MADEVIYGLNEEDRNALQDFMAKVNQLQAMVNTQGRAISAKEDDHQAPEVYVAITPEDGIDALIISDDGGPVPGQALCNIYKLVQLETSYELQSIGEDTLKLVNNLSTDGLDGDEFLLVIRDKFGDWYAVTGGSAPEGSTTTVKPTAARGPHVGSSSSSLDDETFLWDGYIVEIAGSTPTLGSVTQLEYIYIIQRTLGLVPEVERLLIEEHIYSGYYLTDANLSGAVDDFRPVYVVVDAPGSNSSAALVSVVGNITGVVSTCLGNGAISTTVSFTTVQVLGPG